MKKTTLLALNCAFLSWASFSFGQEDTNTLEASNTPQAGIFEPFKYVVVSQWIIWTIVALFVGYLVAWGFYLMLMKPMRPLKAVRVSLLLGGIATVIGLLGSTYAVGSGSEKIKSQITDPPANSTGGEDTNSGSNTDKQAGSNSEGSALDKGGF